MKLFGKKKRYSSLRFCTKAVELPLLHLNVITVAISHIAEFRAFPETRPREEAHANGLIHSWGFHRPLLPVEITFDFRQIVRDGPIASGGLDRWPLDGEEHYKLGIWISDPGRLMFDALLKAMERAAHSHQQFYHVDFRNDYLGSRSRAQGEPPVSKWGKTLEERQALLKAVDDGKAELPYVEFDEIVFDDAVSTRAPSWTWDWITDETTPGRYRDLNVARYRQNSRLPPLPDSE